VPSYNAQSQLRLGDLGSNRECTIGWLEEFSARSKPCESLEYPRDRR
jgi:hypothetical protein